VRKTSGGVSAPAPLRSEARIKAGNKLWRKKIPEQELKERKARDAPGEG
jgi:hypothetical protein